MGNLTALHFSLKGWGDLKGLNRSDMIPFGLLWLRADCQKSEKASAIIMGES